MGMAAEEVELLLIAEGLMLTEVQKPSLLTVHVDINIHEGGVKGVAQGSGC